MLRRFLQYTDKKVGNRGTLLILVGVPWMVLGYGYTHYQQERFSRPGPGGPLQVLDDTPFLGLLWIVGGLIAILCGLIRSRCELDGWGYNGLILPPFIWGAVYLWSWVLCLTSDGAVGRPGVWVATFVYWSFVVIILFLSRRLKDDPSAPVLSVGQNK